MSSHILLLAKSLESFNYDIIFRGCFKMKSNFHFVIQSEAKSLKSVSLCIQILPPYVRLDDRMLWEFHFDAPTFFNL